MRAAALATAGPTLFGCCVPAASCNRTNCRRWSLSFRHFIGLNRQTRGITEAPDGSIETTQAEEATRDGYELSHYVNHFFFTSPARRTGNISPFGRLLTKINGNSPTSRPTGFVRAIHL